MLATKLFSINYSLNVTKVSQNNHSSNAKHTIQNIFFGTKSKVKKQGLKLIST